MSEMVQITTEEHAELERLRSIEAKRKEYAQKAAARQVLLAKKAKDAGLVVSDAEVRAYLASQKAV